MVGDDLLEIHFDDEADQMRVTLKAQLQRIVDDRAAPVDEFQVADADEPDRAIGQLGVGIWR